MPIQPSSRVAHVRPALLLHLFVILGLVVWSLTSFVAPSHLQAQGDDVLRILTTDLSQFPTVAATISYSTSRGEPSATTPPLLVDFDGIPVKDVTVEVVSRPLAVSIVVDLSARMSDQGTVQSSRFSDMRPLLQELVDRLAGGQHHASLVSFNQSVSLAHALTYNLGAVRNTINRSSADQLFEPAPLDSAVQGSPYPLVEALQAGVDQLTAADPEQPLALVLFAAGDLLDLELEALREAIETYTTQKRPIRVLIFSFGSADAGSFTSFPADPNGLEQLTAALGGSFFKLGTKPIPVSERRAIDDAFAGLLRRAEQSSLRFTAENIPAGQATLRVSAGAVEDTTILPLASIPSRFNVVVDSRNFQDRVRLSINTKFVQAEIVNVEYLLDNRLITQPVTNKPNFDFELDAYNATFQERFPPGEYVLNAVATDADGNKSPSETTLTVTLFARPPETNNLAQYWWVGLVVLGLASVAGGAYALVRHTRTNSSLPRSASPRQTDPIMSPPPLAQSAEDWITGEIGGQTTTQEDRPTAELPLHNRGGDAPTGELPATVSPYGRWWLEVVEGDDLILPDGTQTRQIELKGSFVDVGRNESNKIRVAKRYEAVSRRHVTIELFLDKDYIGLRDHESSHGTFIDDERIPVPKGSLTRLKSGQTFSLAGLIKLCVKREQP